MSLRAVARGAPGTLWRRIYTVPNPGAGNDVTFAVPQHRAWQLLAVTAKLTASAVAGNRVPTLTLLDATPVPIARIASPTNVVATNAPICSWTPGVGAAVVVPATMVCLTLPERWYMMPGESLTITGHTDPADTWTQVRVTVLEANTGDPAYIGALERSLEDHIEAAYELTH